MALHFDLTRIDDFFATCYETRTEPPPNYDRRDPGNCPRCESKSEDAGDGECRCLSCDHVHTSWRIFMDCSPNPWSDEPNADGKWSRMSAVTNVIIFKAMALDLGSITAENVDEWMLRLRLRDAFDGREPGDVITTTEKTLREHAHRDRDESYADTLLRAVREGWGVSFGAYRLCLDEPDAAWLALAVEKPDEITFRKSEARRLTREEIEAHIGLTTNVHTVPRKTWCRTMSDAFDRRAAS